MKIGAMDKRIVLLKPIDEHDDYGGQTTDYVKADEVWAMLMQTNYSEQQAQGTPMNRSQLRFKIRSRYDIERGWRVKYSGSFYVVDVVDNTFRDNTSIIVHSLESGV